eukprot:TRINITY_DN7692_c0_g1_i1.p1 TRINITY_DN7692_c0_g1~~TRINITY_DN7692_c0_g1_i1.p1  ORF type:complete len:1043 (+),score=124.74 TRINITY_DN7692_c0_g1_i1:104-3232(+)
MCSAVPRGRTSVSHRGAPERQAGAAPHSDDPHARGARRHSAARAARPRRTASIDAPQRPASAVPPPAHGLLASPSNARCGPRSARSVSCSDRNSSSMCSSPMPVSPGSTATQQQQRLAVPQMTRRRSSSAPHRSLGLLEEAFRRRRPWQQGSEEARPTCCAPLPPRRLSTLRAESTGVDTSIRAPHTGTDERLTWPGPSFVVLAAGDRTPELQQHADPEKAKELQRTALGRLALAATPRGLDLSACSELVYDRTAVTSELPWFQAKDPERAGDTLVFESRFESGNLSHAYRAGPREYDLLVGCDVRTAAHTQWFYFSVEGTRTSGPYRFHIHNFLKPASLFNEGMGVLFYSRQAEVKGEGGWRRVGHGLSYYRNGVPRKKKNTDTSCYSLSFEMTFPYAKDTCYFAYCFPYTLTDMRELLSRVSANPGAHGFLRRKTLCTTLAGNPLDAITITSYAFNPGELRARRGVFITARVHPGECNSSWILKGVLEFLTSDTVDAKTLRDNFVFRLVPMMNPDGVVNGNYRCSLACVDLNRRWGSPSRTLHPEVWHVKQQLQEMASERQVVLFCDLHGHSRKKGMFMYGCSVLSPYARQCRGALAHHGWAPAELIKERIFPRMLSDIAPEIFSYQQSSFSVSHSKRNTARVVAWGELGIDNSYTLEASFCGGPEEGSPHYTTWDFENMGRALCSAVLEYCDPDQLAVSRARRELIAEYNRAYEAGELQRWDEGNSSGSNSPSTDTAGEDELQRSVEPKVLRLRRTQRRRRAPESGQRSGRAATQRRRSGSRRAPGSRQRAPPSPPPATPPDAPAAQPSAASPPLPPQQPRDRQRSPRSHQRQQQQQRRAESDGTERRATAAFAEDPGDFPRQISTQTAPARPCERPAPPRSARRVVHCGGGGTGGGFVRSVMRPIASTDESTTDDNRGGAKPRWAPAPQPSACPPGTGATQFPRRPPSHPGSDDGGSPRLQYYGAAHELRPRQPPATSRDASPCSPAQCRSPASVRAGEVTPPDPWSSGGESAQGAAAQWLRHQQPTRMPDPPRTSRR